MSQNSWLKDIRKWFGCSSLDIFHMVVSRTTLVIWNKRSKGDGIIGTNKWRKITK